MKIAFFTVYIIFRESLDEEFTVTSEQILWLAAHSFADGSGWHKDGGDARL